MRIMDSVLKRATKVHTHQKSTGSATLNACANAVSGAWWCVVRGVRGDGDERVLSVSETLPYDEPAL